MPRSVNSVASRNRRKRILKRAKSFFGRRKNVFSVSKNAVEKALGYAYRDRRVKKRYFRKRWIETINAAARECGITYSKLIHLLKTKNVVMNRKILSLFSKNKTLVNIIKTLK